MALKPSPSELLRALGVSPSHGRAEDRLAARTRAPLPRAGPIRLSDDAPRTPGTVALLLGVRLLHLERKKRRQKKQEHLSVAHRCFPYKNTHARQRAHTQKFPKCPPIRK